jgi:hypothetical protein
VTAQDSGQPVQADAAADIADPEATRTGAADPDIEYDLAHDVPEAAAHGASGSTSEHRLVQTTTQTGDFDEGDYGYDLVHDVPPPSGR